MRTHSFSANSFIDKFLSQYRYSRVFSQLPQKSHQTVVDLGCGQGNLVQTLAGRGFAAFGIDLMPSQRVISANLERPLPLQSESVDFVTSLANIEHLYHPQENLIEIHRVLKKGGRLILTTPSLAAKPILEFISFKLKLIDEREILDHKIYFTKKTLTEALQKAGFKNIVVKRFQLGLNLHAVAEK